MTLIIAEKPLLVRCIADALPGTEKKIESSYLTKGDYTIISAFGHLLELKAPQEYDKKYTTWDIDSLPIYFENWALRPKTDKDGRGTTEKRLTQIGELLKKADKVIHAGDPDEEGQLLIDEILRWFKYKGPVYRLATGDTTEAALKKAITALTENKQHENEGWSAYARSVADFMVGINLSRYFSVKNNPARLSIGRVQTPTLGLVINRDMLIESHKKLKFFAISANLDIENKTIQAKYEPAKDDTHLTDGKITEKAYAEAIQDALANSHFDNISIEVKEELESPPLPFNFDELQLYCGKKFGYTPSDTLEITQKLRDNYNAITYNRSDCRYLSENHYQEAPSTMNAVINNIGFRPKKLDMTIKSKCFNDANITAHFAIIPQNISTNISQFSEAEKNVYLAICKYYMAQFLPPAKKALSKLVIGLPDGGTLVAYSCKILEQGYLSIFKSPTSEKGDDGDDTAENETLLSSFASGIYSGDVKAASISEKETKPPARYTESTLMKDMSRISKFVDNESVKKLLLSKDKEKKGENGSIGTVATRPPIIKGLIDKGFLETKGKNVVSTALGRELYRILPDEIKKADMTAYWWVIQEEIKKGNSSPKALETTVLKMINKIISTDYPPIDKSALPARTIGGKPAVGECPWCGKPVIEGKTGFGCSGWKEGCKFVIWKTSKLPVFKNVTFSSSDAAKLLQKKSILKTQLVGKTGNTFEAYLSLKDNKGDPYGASFAFTFKDSKKRTSGSRKKSGK